MRCTAPGQLLTAPPQARGPCQDFPCQPQSTTPWNPVGAGVSADFCAPLLAHRGSHLQWARGCAAAQGIVLLAAAASSPMLDCASALCNTRSSTRPGAASRRQERYQHRGEQGGTRTCRCSEPDATGGSLSFFEPVGDPSPIRAVNDFIAPRPPLAPDLPLTPRGPRQRRANVFQSALPRRGNALGRQSRAPRAPAGASSGPRRK